MFSKLLLAGAGAATVFGITAASASTLTLATPGAWFHHTVQQSDEVSASCVTGALEVSLNVDGLHVPTVTLPQQYLQSCGGSEAQVVAYNTAGDIIGATTLQRITANGNDVVLSFPSDPLAQDIASTRVTIADNITSPAPSTNTLPALNSHNRA